jgi:hypothetical protein
MFTGFDPEGSTFTQVFAINDKGAVTGWYQDSKGTHGYVRRP